MTFYTLFIIHYYFYEIVLNDGIYVYNLLTKSDYIIECLGIGSILRTSIRKNF